MFKNDLVPKIISNDLIKNNQSWKDFIPSMIYWPAIIIQIILVFFYYNVHNIYFLFWMGWVFMVLFLIIGSLPRSAFLKFGEIKKGKSHIYTTKLVDKGIYGIIRHPYWLCWTFLSISLTLISQNIIMFILALIVLPIIYLETFMLDKRLINKFGEDYRQYQKSVPRMNLILGIFKYIRRKRKYN
ncbi:MAG: methyltransferase family protein [Promethearchaeota archaeon]